MRQDWFSREAEPIVAEPKPAPAPPAQRSLQDILKERETKTPVMANPTGIPEQPEPISLKELSDILESAAKDSLAGKLSLEKAHFALSKVGAMQGPTPMDKEMASRSQAFAAQAEKIGDSIEALANEIKAYREQLSKPSNHWLG